MWQIFWGWETRTEDLQGNVIGFFWKDLVRSVPSIWLPHGCFSHMDTLSVWSRNGFAVSGSSHAGFDQQWKKVLWFGWCTGPVGGLGEGNTYQSWTMCRACRRTCSTRTTNCCPFKGRRTSIPCSTYSTSWWSSTKSENPLLWWPAYQSATGLCKRSKSKQPYSTG